jgi:heme A synthase
MYVIAIGWLYVTLLMAATEPNLTAGVLTFAVYGAAPLALFLWLFGTPQRNRNRRAREAIGDAAARDDKPPPPESR